MLAKMAWRNLWRQKRRTLITCGSVAFGVFLAFTLTGIAENSYFRLVDTGAMMGSGHVVFQPEGWDLHPSLDRTLADATALQREADADPRVRTTLVHIQGQAMFASGSKTAGGAFIALDPAREGPDVNLFLRCLKEGELFAEAGGDGAVVGERLAQRLGLRLGKKLVYTSTDKRGEIVSDVVRIRGIFRTGVAEVDASTVLLPIDRVRKTLGYAATEATTVSVLLRDQQDAPDVARLYREAQRGAGVAVLTWDEAAPDLAGLIAVDRGMNRLFQIFVGLLIAAGILNTILMSVLERQREFGVMMAVGMPPTRLVAMVLVESVFVAVVGLIAGIVATVPWYLYLATVGIDLTPMLGDGYNVGGVLMDPTLRLFLRPRHVLAVLAGVFGLTILAGLYPAIRAGLVQPVESIRLV